MIVDFPKLVGKPEIHHVGKVQRAKGIDVDMLALMQDQLAVGCIFLQTVIKSFDVAWLNVVVVEPMDHHNAGFDLIDPFAIIAAIPKIIVVAGLTIHCQIHLGQIAIIDFLNPPIVARPLGTAKAFGCQRIGILALKTTGCSDQAIFTIIVIPTGNGGFTNDSFKSFNTSCSNGC